MTTLEQVTTSALRVSQSIAQPFHNVALPTPSTAITNHTLSRSELLKSLKMTCPSHTIARRFEKNIKINTLTEDWTITRMEGNQCQSRCEHAAANWERLVNPDGQPYYNRLDGGPDTAKYRFLTEENLCDKVLLSEISERVSAMLPEIQKLSSKDLCIILEKSSDEWCYYMVDNSKRANFWLEPSSFSVEYIVEQINGLPGLSYMEQWFLYEYWQFRERFPHVEPVLDADINGLIGMLSQGFVDAKTSTGSTMVYTPDDCFKMVMVVKTLKDTQACEPYLTWTVSRLIGLLTQARFMNMYGNHGARLDPKQSIRGAAKPHRSGFIKLLSPILFYAPEVHLQNLEEIWVDKAIVEISWLKYKEELKNDWNQLLTNATIVLASNVAYLAVPNVNPAGDQVYLSISQVLSFLSTIFSLGSIIIGLLLLRQHQTKLKDTASEAARYLLNHTQGTLGLELLAVVYSLQFSLLMWSVLYFVIAVVIFCLEAKSYWLKAVFAFAWSILALLVVSTICIGRPKVADQLTERIDGIAKWLKGCYSQILRGRTGYVTQRDESASDVTIQVV